MQNGQEQTQRENRVLRRKEAARYCGISLRTMENLYNRGDFVERVEISDRMVGFRLFDLDEWIEKRKGTKNGSKK